MELHIRECVRAYYDFWFGINRIYMEWAKRDGLTVYELFTLNTIYEHPADCTPKMICEALMLPKQTINSILNDFEKKGYIVRRASQTDRRSTVIGFTEVGKQWAGEILRRMYAMEAAAMKRMEVRQREGMKTGNQAFLNAMRAMIEEDKD